MCLDAEGTFQCFVVVKTTVNATFQIYSVSLTFERTAEIRDSKKWAATFSHLENWLLGSLAGMILIWQSGKSIQEEFF